MRRRLLLSLFVFSAVVASGIAMRSLKASDHDDGENDVKARALNITDHYAYREDSDNSKLILQMSTNPRSLARQQYFFSTQARYEFHVTRVGSTVAQLAAAPTGASDMIFRFEFSAPDSSDVQDITFTVIKDGATVGTATGSTTNLEDSTTNSGGSLTVNTMSVGGVSYSVFAGLREDAFHFDVERFFQVRAFLIDRFVNGNGAATLATTCDGQAIGAANATEQSPVQLFNPRKCAEDFTHNYNVNAIVLRAPISALKLAGTETTFDTWSTVSIPQ